MIKMDAPQMGPAGPGLLKASQPEDMRSDVSKVDGRQWNESHAASGLDSTTDQKNLQLSATVQVRRTAQTCTDLESRRSVFKSRGMSNEKSASGSSIRERLRRQRRVRSSDSD